MAPADRPLVWLRTEVKTPPFSASARLGTGFLLRRLQRGERLGLPQARSMPSIASRCVELRIPDGEHTWRIVCRVDADAVVIADVFSKKTQKTPQLVIRLVVGVFESTTVSLEAPMDKAKRKKLEDAGWVIGSTADFLDLTEDEAAFVELKLALSEQLRVRREDQGITQVALAKKLGSSQSRVAKMEASDPSVSVDLLIRGLLATGASRNEIASAFAPKPRRPRRSSSRRTAKTTHR